MLFVFLLNLCKSVKEIERKQLATRSLEMNTQHTDMFEKRCKEAGALWSYPGRGAHVVLHSGRHSDFFFDGGKVVSDPILLDQMCGNLAHQVSSEYDLSNLKWVVGPAMGAIKIADGVARHLAYMLQLPIKSSYTEKTDGGMAFLKADAPKPGDLCLVVEDTLTTGDSSNMCAEQIIARDATVLPVRLALVNRSGDIYLSTGKGVLVPPFEKIISVLSYNPKSWIQEECPLCLNGSEAIKEPKKQKNWGRLIASGTVYK